MSKFTHGVNLADIPLEDYIKFKKNKVSKQWKDDIVKTGGDNSEYYKGQFIILRELLEPKYRREEP